MANVPLPLFRRMPTVLLLVPIVAHDQVGIAVAVEVAGRQAARDAMPPVL